MASFSLLKRTDLELLTDKAAELVSEVSFLLSCNQRIPKIYPSPAITLMATSPTRGEVLNTSVHFTSPLVGEVNLEQSEGVGEGENYNFWLQFNIA